MLCAVFRWARWHDHAYDINPDLYYYANFLIVAAGNSTTTFRPYLDQWPGVAVMLMRPERVVFEPPPGEVFPWASTDHIFPREKVRKWGIYSMWDNEA